MVAKNRNIRHLSRGSVCIRVRRPPVQERAIHEYQRARWPAISMPMSPNPNQPPQKKMCTISASTVPSWTMKQRSVQLHTRIYSRGAAFRHVMVAFPRLTQHILSKAKILSLSRQCPKSGLRRAGFLATPPTAQQRAKLALI